MLFTGRHTATLAEPLAARMREGGLIVAVYSEISQEPTTAVFETAVVAARDFSPDTVVGVGGGSPLDVAKLAATLIDESRDLYDCFGIGVLTHRNAYLVCLPTTSGTGSEVSPNSILLDEEAQLKKGVISPWLVPDATFIDPELMVSMPPLITASTGMDALTHCIEAYANRFAHSGVDMYALGGIRLIGGNLLAAIRCPGDLEVREKMAVGSLFGGFCLGPVNTAAVHALSYPLGGRFHVPHGMSNALLLPHILRFNLPAAVGRYADIAVALGIERAATDEQTALRGIEALGCMASEACIPLRLRDWEVPHSAIEEMAIGAMEVTRLLRNNPREITRDDAMAIYEAAY
jgi:alcohol dehydrogenase class IV